MSEKNQVRTPSEKRRTFLKSGWSWLRLSALLAICYPALKFLHFKAPKQPVHVKVLKTIPVGGYAVEQDFILFVGEDGPWAISRRCTHLGCRLHFIDKEEVLQCPCHHSRFSPKGKLISGPAKDDLENYKVVRLNEGDGNGYMVTL